MNTLICAGGTGVRVLESLLHLCAAGLGPRNLRLLVIDPDGANGNFTRTRELVSIYERCYGLFAAKLGHDFQWFGTELDLLDPTARPGEERRLPLWSPVQAGEKLASVINYDNLDSFHQDVVHLLFTKQELEAVLDQGFRGHPAIGAATMSLVSLHQHSTHWKDLTQKIKQDVNGAGSRVFIVGSVFGGTGAAAIHPIARFLRTVPQLNADRLKIGVAALVPYFCFGGADAREMAARSQWFSLATRAAVEFYDHLRRNEDWPFDAVYWLGDSSLRTVNCALGGPQQRNPAHFVDLLAALAALEFFDAPETAAAPSYAGPEKNPQPATADRQNQLAWTDIPLRRFHREDLRNRLLEFFMAGVAHLDFYEPMLKRKDLDRQARCVPWYYERFKKKGDSLRTEANEGALKTVSQFYRERHFPWWAEIHHDPDSASVRLFDPNTLKSADGGGMNPDLSRLSHLLWTGESNTGTRDDFDRFFTDMVVVKREQGGERGVAAYLSLLGYAARAYIRREYKKAEAQHA